MKKNRWFAVISAMVMALAVAGCSDPSSGTGNSGVDYSKYQVGDFVLKDGTILSKDKTPDSGTVAAVIVRAAADNIINLRIKNCFFDLQSTYLLS